MKRTFTHSDDDRPAPVKDGGHARSRSDSMMVAVGLSQRKKRKENICVVERHLKCLGLPRSGLREAANQASLRDAGACRTEPWAEAHGYRYAVAPRLCLPAQLRFSGGRAFQIFDGRIRGSENAVPGFDSVRFVSCVTGQGMLHTPLLRAYCAMTDSIVLFPPAVFTPEKPQASSPHVDFTTVPVRHNFKSGEIYEGKFRGEKNQTNLEERTLQAAN